MISLSEFADLSSVPYCGRVLVESLLRNGDNDKAALLVKRLAAGEDPELEMEFRPARILVQDYTGIPLLVDLAALRDRVDRPSRVNPALPVDVVVDHSVQTDFAGRPDALSRNESLELGRNGERYAFLKWAERAFDRLRVIPPGQGIVHQVNLERLATVVARTEDGDPFPDSVIGTARSGLGRSSTTSPAAPSRIPASRPPRRSRRCSPPPADSRMSQRTVRLSRIRTVSGPSPPVGLSRTRGCPAGPLTWGVSPAPGGVVIR